MGASPAFSFYAKDFLTGTATMSLVEVGAYVRLLAYQWDAGFVPNSDQKRARILCCSVSQSRKVWERISDKFVLVGDGYQNARLEEEREKQAEYRRRQSDRGKASAQARFNRGSTPVQPGPVEVRLQPEVNSSSSSSSSKEQERRTPRPLATKRNLSAEFEHERFDVPVSWHLRTVKGLSDGEARLMKFYRWLAERVERTNEDTLPRFEWLDRCFKEWLDAAPARSSVPSPEATAKMIADRIAMAGR